MSNIEIRAVSSRKDLNNFIKIVWKINSNDHHWVPPLLMDRIKVLDRKKNPFFKHAEAEYFLACRNEEIVGRIAAITNRRHNEFHKDNTGFFGFLEGVNDPQVFKMLLDTAKGWLQAKGKDYMIGPMNPSTNDEIGFLIDGFDTPPYFMMTHNPPYYDDIMKKLGYEKIKDVYAYHIQEDTFNISEKLVKVTSAIKEKMGITLRSVNLNNFKEELEHIRYVYNNAWSKNWGFVPMTPEEFDYIAEDFKKIIDPELVLIAELKGKPVGFSLALPDYNRVFAKIKNGKLFPTGWIKFLTERKKIDNLRVVTLGVVQELQHIGIGGLFYVETFNRGTQKGYHSAEMSWILEDNELMVKATKLMGAQRYKTYRIYGSPL